MNVVQDRFPQGGARLPLEATGTGLVTASDV